jgi:hypothetical protein
MPNWCMNNITVEHTDSAMVDRFEKAYNEGRTCEEFLPVPEGYYDNGEWYNYCVNTWGTKWDIGADIGTDKNPEQYALKATRVGNQVSASFDSAWAPPVGLYDKLFELGYNVKATYWEAGMGFCGIWDNGYDNYVEYSDAEKPEEVIPVALWNDYNMDEFFEHTEEA